MTGFDTLGQLNAIHAGHFDIGKNDIKLLLANLLQSFVGVLRGGYDVAFFGQNPVETLANNGIIVDHQNFAKCTHDISP
jgi:hypothetical protein